jgi:hypothetical protein
MMTMIFFKAKPAATAPVKPEQPTVESSKRGEETASGRRKKSDTDGALRGQRKTTDDDRLI